MSLYYGLSAELQLLSVSFLSIAMQSNTFANCSVRASADLGGNAYGGAVSLYIGAYSSAYFSTGAAVAAVGDTVVRDVNVTLDTVEFKSCSAIRERKQLLSSFGANVYGGSYSFYIGSYSSSFSSSSSSDSSSTCGSTNASGITVCVQNTTSVDCSAISTSGSQSYGANSYGGSMSVLLVGAYSWSYSSSGYSNSVCEFTSASDVSVHVSGSGCSNCSAISTSGANSYGANSYGGALSAAFVGAYSYGYEIENYAAIQAFVTTTQVVRLSVVIQDSIIVDAEAASGEYCSTRSIPPRTGLTLSVSIVRRLLRSQCECFR